MIKDCTYALKCAPRFNLIYFSLGGGGFPQAPLGRENLLHTVYLPPPPLPQQNSTKPCITVIINHPIGWNDIQLQKKSTY